MSRIYTITLGYILIFINLSACLSNDYNKNHCLSCHREHYKEKGSCYFCHQGVSLSKDKELAHYTLIPKSFSFFRLPHHPKIKEGRKYIYMLGCRRCHKIEGQGNNLATDIDHLHSPFYVKELVKAIEHPAYYMPFFSFARKNLESVVNYILYASSTYNTEHGNDSYRVHFLNKNYNTFEQKCGECHKILTRNYGGLGKGNVGPNLSGILTKFYPRNSLVYPCSTKKLIKWISNPRSIAFNTTMPPILMKKKELNQILSILKN